MRLKTIFLVFLGVFVMLPSLCVWGRQVSRRSIPAPSMAKFSAVGTIVRDKCMHCHTQDYALPFYANIPGIKRIVERDYIDGLRAMDLREEFGVSVTNKPVSESTLAKMEWVMVNETMPPAKFAAVHWDSRISNRQREIILDWVKTTRSAYYATGTASKEKSNEPVQPLPEYVNIDAKKAALGRKLFEDTRLSVDNSISCASCHMLEQGGADARRFSEGVGKQLGNVNSPTVFNCVFNMRQFWDGRAADLQEQAGGPPFNPIEMGSKDWDQIIAKLAADRFLEEEFFEVYPPSPAPGDNAGGWSGENITDAIAEYEKSLITPNSRFDKWLRGDNQAISDKELEGYMRFKAYRCSSCHVGKSLGGQSFEYMDLKKDYFADRGDSLPSDEGLKAFSGRKEDLHKFKVPNLRNIELTAPYLHDGTALTLEDAIKVMGVYLSGLEVTPGDRKLIVGFLRTLTGEYQGKKVMGDVSPQDDDSKMDF